jgi:hypothetical protein
MHKPRRRRHYTEMVGCGISLQEYEVLRAEMARRKLSVAEYLRRVAIAPLMSEVAQQAEGQPDGQA